MRCDEVEGVLLEAPDEVPAGVTTHLETCAACRLVRDEAAQALAFAALPEPSDAERAALATLEVATLAAWRGESRGPGGVWRVVLAAGLGAVVAATGVLSLVPPRTVEVVRVSRVEVPVAAEFFGPAEWPDAPSVNFPDDEVFEEVSWPDQPEGETP